MAATTVNVQMQQRRDTAANWTSSNPTLLEGELGFETDTKKAKLGDGSTAWNSLTYYPGFSISGYPLATSDISNDAITAAKLANTSVTAGSYTAADITVDAQGRITAAASGTVGTSEIADGSITSAKLDTDITIAGNLTVNGTTTTINSTTLQVDDKNIELGTVASPSDTLADGGGITLKGSTDHTITWTNSTDSWDLSEHVNIASGKEFKVNGTSVLSAGVLGSTVTASSLTSVGTITTGTWSASTIAVDKGGTGQTSYTNGQLLIGNTTGNTLSKATLTAGSNITITNGAGSIEIASTVPDADKIIEGNTEAEVVDTGSDGHFKVTTEGTERIRVGPAGQLGIAGANYGTSGQVLLSGGASGAVTWGSAPAAAGVIAENKRTIDADYTLSTNYNGMSAGPVAVDSGVTVTVPASAIWLIF